MVRMRGKYESALESKEIKGRMLVLAEHVRHGSGRKAERHRGAASGARRVRCVGAAYFDVKSGCLRFKRPRNDSISCPGL